MVKASDQNLMFISAVGSKLNCAIIFFKYKVMMLQEIDLEDI